MTLGADWQTFLRYYPGLTLGLGSDLVETTGSGSGGTFQCPVFLNGVQVGYQTCLDFGTYLVGYDFAVADITIGGVALPDLDPMPAYFQIGIEVHQFVSGYTASCNANNLGSGRSGGCGPLGGEGANLSLAPAHVTYISDVTGVSTGGTFYFLGDGSYSDPAAPASDLLFNPADALATVIEVNMDGRGHTFSQVVTPFVVAFYPLDEGASGSAVTGDVRRGVRSRGRVVGRTVTPA